MEIRSHDKDCRDDAPLSLEGIKVFGYGVFHAGPGAGAILGDPGGQGDPWEVNKTTWRFTKNEHFGYRA